MVNGKVKKQVTTTEEAIAYVNTLAHYFFTRCYSLSYVATHFFPGCFPTLDLYLSFNHLPTTPMMLLQTQDIDNGIFVVAIFCLLLALVGLYWFIQKVFSVNPTIDKIFNAYDNYALTKPLNNSPKEAWQAYVDNGKQLVAWLEGQFTTTRPFLWKLGITWPAPNQHLTASYKEVLQQIRTNIDRITIEIQSVDNWLHGNQTNDSDLLNDLLSTNITHNHYQKSAGEKAQDMVKAIAELHKQRKAGAISEGNYNATLWALMDTLEKEVKE